MVPDNNLYQKLSIKIFFVTFCVACVASDQPQHTHSMNVHVWTFSTRDLQTEISNVSHQKSESTTQRQPRRFNRCLTSANFINHKTWKEIKVRSGGKDPPSNCFCNETPNLAKIKSEFWGFSPLGCSAFCFVYIHKCTASGSQERLQFIKGGKKNSRGFLSARYSQTYGIHASRLFMSR